MGSSATIIGSDEVVTRFKPEFSFDTSRPNIEKDRVVSSPSGVNLEQVETHTLIELRDFLPRYWVRGLNSKKDRFIILQKWEAVVLEVSKRTFTARLRDLTDDNPEEEGDFDLEEVSLSDRELVQPGAFFYWTIGYHDNESRTRESVSRIRFRRVPMWTKRAIETSKQAGEKLAMEFRAR